MHKPFGLIALQNAGNGKWATKITFGYLYLSQKYRKFGRWTVASALLSSSTLLATKWRPPPHETVGIIRLLATFTLLTIAIIISSFSLVLGGVSLLLTILFYNKNKKLSNKLTAFYKILYN